MTAHTTVSEEVITYLDPERRIQITRNEHYLWTMWNERGRVWRRLSYPFNGPVVGRWHFIYTNDRGQHISLIYTERYCGWRWEICSGGTCSNCVDADELFKTRKDAEVRILELLG